MRLSYLGKDGEVLIDVTPSEEGWARGIKGSFLADGSTFRDKLVRSAWKN